METLLNHAFLGQFVCIWPVSGLAVGHLLSTASIILTSHCALSLQVAKAG